MQTRNHVTEPGYGLFGTLAKTRPGEIATRIAVYVHGRAGENTTHATLCDRAGDLIGKMIARIEKTRSAALDHLQLAQLRAQQRLVRAERVFEWVNTPVKPFLDMTIVSEAAGELLGIVRVSIDEAGKNQLALRVDHPVRAMSGDHVIALAYGDNSVGLNGKRAVAENPSIGIDGNQPIRMGNDEIRHIVFQKTGQRGAVRRSSPARRTRLSATAWLSFSTASSSIVSTRRSSMMIRPSTIRVSALAPVAL